MRARRGVVAGDLGARRRIFVCSLLCGCRGLIVRLPDVGRDEVVLMVPAGVGNGGMARTVHHDVEFFGLNEGHSDI